MRACTRHRAALIFDEIQTGLDRIGRLLTEEYEDIVARDVTLLGKALGGGFHPISAVLSNTEVLGTLKLGQHGSTFGGNPPACGVARSSAKSGGKPDVGDRTRTRSRRRATVEVPPRVIT